MKVTVYDIAKKAKVSQSTVSKVLNNYPQIKNSTRQKVLAVIEELGFVPDPIARSLVSKSTKTLGLIVGDISNPFYSEIAKIIMSTVRDFGYDVIISDTDYGKVDIEHTINNLISRRVDGILIAALERNNNAVINLKNSGFPIVLFCRTPDQKGMHQVIVDDKMGAKLATNYLISLGHKKIAFVTGSVKYSTFHQRFLGFKEEINNSFSCIYDENLIFNRDKSDENIQKFVLNALKNGATSFFAATDSIAIDIMAILTNFGLTVPNDISVIGFDDIDMASHPLINLTTVSQNKAKLATEAISTLFKLIKSEIPLVEPIQITLEPKLIIRETTGYVSKSLNYEKLDIKL